MITQISRMDGLPNFLLVRAWSPAKTMISIPKKISLHQTTIKRNHQGHQTKITIDGITVGHSVIAPQSPARNLGVWLDSNLSMGDHITKTSSAAFYYLYNIRRIRKYLSKECAETLIHAFISSRLDYCNSLLYGLPAYQIQKLQRVQNSAARLVFEESKFCHITPLLRVLHWLPIAYRIVFKTLLLTFKAIHKLTPTYISELVSLKDTGGRYYL